MAKAITDESKIQEFLSKAVVDIIPDKKELANLMEKRKIRLYLGIDPTGARLHLGHSIALRKLQAFADAGHEAILLFGTGTILAGDPSQREEARERMGLSQIKRNISTWKKQVKPIIDFNKVKIMHNGKWLLKLTLKDIIEIASNISAAQLFKREMFQRRLKRGDVVWTHEVLYPLLQGYDSVAMDVDLEIGGTDQTFNMLVGRELMKKMRGKNKFVLTVPMIAGIDGSQMSKSRGNCVWLDDSPSEMFGKLMSMPDSQTESYLTFLTDISEAETKELIKDPLKAKQRLAWEIVKVYHSEKHAERALKDFNRVFKEGSVPQEIPEFKFEEDKIGLVDLLVKTGLASSASEAKRLVEQKSVKIGGQNLSDWRQTIDLKDGLILKVGPRRFAKIKK